MPKLPLLEQKCWFNAEPDIVNNLTGKIVLIDFWDYTCNNCIRTFPYISEWHKRYADKGLIIIGVHAPEFEFAKERENVARAVADFSLRYPIVMDNDLTIWNYLSNRCWPARYIFDIQGMLRYHHVGEGNYAEIETMIQKLLCEINKDIELPEIMKPVRDTDAPGAVCYTVTPKMYLGNEKGRIGNEEACGGTGIFEFLDPGTYQEDTFYLEGTWCIGPEYIHPASENREPCSIIVNYSAAEVNAVIGPEKEDGVKVYIEQDENALTPDNKGSDIKTDYEDGRTYLLMERPKMYNIVRNNKTDRHILRLTATSHIVATYVLTFVSSCKISPPG